MVKVSLVASVDPVTRSDSLTAGSLAVARTSSVGFVFGEMSARDDCAVLGWSPIETGLEDDAVASWGVAGCEISASISGASLSGFDV